MGNYNIYGRIGLLVPNNTFRNITNSTDIYFYLMKIGYLDSDGFITDSFNGDLQLET